MSTVRQGNAAAATPAVSRKGAVWTQRFLFRTGVLELDKVLGGVAMGEILVAAASTGMGKTAFGLAMARCNAEKQSRTGRPMRVLYILAEMMDGDVAERMASAATGIDWDRIRYENHDAPLTRGERARVEAAFESWNAIVTIGGFTLWSGGDAHNPISCERIIRQLARTNEDGSPYWDLALMDYWGVVVPSGGKDALQLAHDFSTGLEATVQASGTALVIFAQLGSEGMSVVEGPLPLRNNLVQGPTVLPQKAWRTLFIEPAWKPAPKREASKRLRWERVKCAAGFGVAKDRLGKAQYQRVAVTFWHGSYGKVALNLMRSHLIDQTKRAFGYGVNEELSNAEQQRVMAQVDQSIDQHVEDLNWMKRARAGGSQHT